MQTAGWVPVTAKPGWRNDAVGGPQINSPLLSYPTIGRHELPAASPVSVTKAENWSTVTSNLPIAIGFLMTVRRGNPSPGSREGSPSGEPSMKSPADKVTISGQSSQSLKVG